MESVGRRSFFAALGGGATAAAALAQVPEPDDVRRIPLASGALEASGPRQDHAAGYVLTFGGPLPVWAEKSIKDAWAEAFAAKGLKAPLLLVLDSGVKLERL